MKEEIMTNMDFLKDDLLKRMLTKASLDQPSADFTAGVMNRIKLDLASKDANQPILSLKYWLLIGLGFIAASFVLFGLDWSFMNGVFGEVNMENVQLPSLSFNIVSNLQAIFKDFHVSPVIIISLVAVFSLIVLDKILKKTFSTHIFLLI
ncbi:MAG: hypothetical protein CVU00_03335 [Bacteroidetes bacterium HGW-Bacteroidetes-17]|jgi:hypothetical protein|nr:MAG: hypothetical protein CVU00_03335 [Bacteroidetes bacterium HGW-Bacteroidetes-17]